MSYFSECTGEPSSQDALLMDTSSSSTIVANGWRVDTNVWDGAYEACKMPTPASISGATGGWAVGGMEATLTGKVLLFQFIRSN